MGVLQTLHELSRWFEEADGGNEIVALVVTQRGFDRLVQEFEPLIRLRDDAHRLKIGHVSEMQVGGLSIRKYDRAGRKD